MSRFMVTLGLLGSLLTGSAWAQDGAKLQEYALDPSESLLAVLIRYERGTLLQGHDHGARARTFNGQVRWSNEAVSRCDVQITVPLDALEVDPTGLRERLGLEGETSANTASKIARVMWGPKVLDIASFPQAQFKSTSCVNRGDKTAVTGQMSLHGVTAPVTVLMSIQVDESRFKAKGVLKFQHADFGMAPYRAMLGALRNDPALEIHIDVVGQASPKPAAKGP